MREGLTACPASNWLSSYNRPRRAPLAQAVVEMEVAKAPANAA